MRFQDPPPREQLASELRIHLLGGFLVKRGGLPVPDVAWQRPTARSLVKLLALAPGRTLHREHAIDLLWPDLDLDAGLNSFGKALYQARHAIQHDLARGPQSRFPHLSNNILSLDPAVWVDVDEFSRLAASALADPSISKLQAALDAGAGKLLPENRYAEWAESVRDTLADISVRLTLTLAEQLGQSGEIGRAVTTLQVALQRDPASEEVHRAVMRALAATGNRQGVLRQYQRCAEMLRQELDVEPDEETQALYNSVREHQTAAPLKRAPLPPLPLPVGVKDTLATTLVGREHALHFLMEALDRAGNGEGDTILIGGEAGVGKTRIAAETARAAQTQGALVLWGAGYDQKGMLPYGAVVDAIEEHLRGLPEVQCESLATRFPELGAVIPSVSGHILAEPPLNRTRLFGAIVRLLDDLTGSHHLLLALDDLQSVDAESFGLLHHLVRTAVTRRWLIVGAYREEDAQPDGEFQRFAISTTRQGLCRRIDLRRLDRADADQLIRTLLPPGEADADLLKSIYAQSLGNPLYIQELLREMRDRGALVLRDGSWRVTETSRRVPRQIRDLVEAHVHRMDTATQRVLALAAAIGMESPSVVLQRVADQIGLDPDARLDALERTLQSRILEERPDGYAFRHPLFRETLYERLSRPRRARLHAVVAVAIDAEQPDNVEALALHWAEAEDHGRACSYLKQAGDRAAALHAAAAAIRSYDDALHHAVSLQNERDVTR